VAEIGAREGPPLGLSVAECVQYLTEYIRFDLGPRAIEGLNLFYREAARLGLVPEGVSRVFRDQPNLAEVH
jgi:hypothetical protein